MKKILILIFSVMLLLSACGGQETETAPVETQPTTEEVTTEPISLNIGPYFAELISAQTYDPYGDGPYLIVSYQFTNNSEEACMPAAHVLLTAAQGDQSLEHVDFIRDDAPENYGNQRKQVQPGATVACYEAFSYNPADGTIFVTFSDGSYEQQEELIVNLEPAALEAYDKA